MAAKARQPYKPEEKKRLDAALRANLRRRKLAPAPPAPPELDEQSDPASSPPEGIK